MRCMFTTKQLHPDVDHCLIPSIEISLEESAQLDLLNLVDGVGSWRFDTVRAVLKKSARFESLNLNFGIRRVRQSHRVWLKGENSQAELSGLWMLEKNQQGHTHTSIEHLAPHTRSMQHFRGVLNDYSQLSFIGKIRVEPQAQKTEAYQLNHNLILSQGACVNTKPNLEISADDVKASHGATVSQLDDNQLFYLSTRGMDRDAAKQLLIAGFCRQVIDKIPYPSVLKHCHQHMKARVGVQHA